MDEIDNGQRFVNAPKKLGKGMPMGSALDAGTDEARMGSFSYMAASAEPSLYRNGKVFTRRDRDGSDAGWENKSLNLFWAFLARLTAFFEAGVAWLVVVIMVDSFSPPHVPRPATVINTLNALQPISCPFLDPGRCL